MASPNRAEADEATAGESNIGEECKKDEKDEKDLTSALPKRIPGHFLSDQTPCRL